MTDRLKRPLPPGALQLLDRERMVALALKVADRALPDLYELIVAGAIPALDHFDEQPCGPVNGAGRTVTRLRRRPDRRGFDLPQERATTVAVISTGWPADTHRCVT